MATSKTLKPTNVTIQIPEFTDQPDQRVNSNCIDKLADAVNAVAPFARMITSIAHDAGQAAFVQWLNSNNNSLPIGTGSVISFRASGHATSYDTASGIICCMNHNYGTMTLTSYYATFAGNYKLTSGTWAAV